MDQNQRSEEHSGGQMNTAGDVVLFSAQVGLIFCVVLTSLFNLSMEWGNQNLWTMVLTSCLGYIMPNPKIKISTLWNNKSIKDATQFSNNVPHDI